MNKDVKLDTLFRTVNMSSFLRILLVFFSVEIPDWIIKYQYIKLPQSVNLVFATFTCLLSLFVYIKNKQANKQANEQQQQKNNNNKEAHDCDARLV